jgi:hypothetical protein
MKRESPMEHEHRQDEIVRLRDELGRLAAQMQLLEQARHLDAHQIQNLTHANAIQNVISQGLDAIREYLQPLRDLTPSRTGLDERGMAVLVALRTDAERPRWNGDESFEAYDWATAVPRISRRDK